MDNAEEIFHFLEDFSKRKPKTIPQELNDYLAYVARTGDPVYQWSLVKCLFKEKLLNVITDFYETSPGIDIPPYPNVDPFNYDTLKNSLIERLDSFTSAPFTVQRICELLAFPRKQYNRVDKYMRAIEKNILVVSTREPGVHRHVDAENGEQIVNGSDNNSEYNVDVEMEDMSWKETREQGPNSEPQPSSSESYSIAEIEARLRTKQAFLPASVEKSVDTPSPPQQTEQNANKEKVSDTKTNNLASEAIPSTSDSQKVETNNIPDKAEKMDTDVKSDEPGGQAIIIPEIKINDTSIDENITTNVGKDNLKLEKQEEPDDKCVAEQPQSNVISPEPKPKEMEVDTKLITEVSEASSSSEESSSSSDNTDGNSNSPKPVSDDQMDEREASKTEVDKPDIIVDPVLEAAEKSPAPTVMQSDNYSITDVNSELPQIPAGNDSKSQESVEDKTEETPTSVKESKDEKTETTDTEKKTETSENPNPV